MNEDNFIEEWLDHYPNRKMAYSEAANYLRSKQPEQQPVEEPDQWIPQSNLRQRSEPGHEDIPAMPDPRNMPDTLSDDEKPGMVAQFIKTIYPQAQLDDNIIAGIVGDFARPFTDNPAGPAMAGGVRDLGQGLVEVASEVSDALGLGPIDVELPQIESADDPAAHLVRGMTQFFAGFGAAGGLAKGATLMRQTLAGGAADATFDPELGNLSTLLREQFNVDNALVDYLDAKVGEDADAAERLNARVKMVLEGAGLGALVPAAMFTMRQMKEGAPESIQAVKDVIAGRPGNLQKQLGMVAFHGTPHKWESGVPDLSKVGTGEGAQAYGHGIYFAENPNVAKSYQGKVSAMSGTGKPQVNGRDINWDDPIETAGFEMARHNGDRKAAAEFYERTFSESDVPDILRSDQKLPKVEFPGNLYEVDIPDAEIDRMLDWDAPLSEQSESVQKALKRAKTKENVLHEPTHIQILNEYLSGAEGTANAKGWTIYSEMQDALGGQKEASMFLRELGIPGIKYLDQQSRPFLNVSSKTHELGKQAGSSRWGFYDKKSGYFDADLPLFGKKADAQEWLDGKRGTRNFVIFDEELLNKLKVGEAE